MTDQRVEVILDGKDAGLVRAWLAGRDSVAAYEAGLKKLEPAQRDNAKAAAEFERAARQAFESTRTPQERFAKEQERLQDLFQSGLIDVQTYNRALNQQKQVLEQSDEALQKRLATERQQAAMAARIIDSLLGPQEKYARKLQELNDLHKAGHLSADQFAAAVSREKAALDSTNVALQEQKRRREELGQAAKRVIDSIMTPQERYNQKMAELNRLLSAGAINQQTFARASEAARREMDGVTKTGGNLVGSLTGIAASYLSVTGALTSYLSETQRGIDLQTKEAGIVDDLTRKYSVVAGIRGMESERGKQAIKAAALSTATPKDKAGEAATELVSAGMEHKEVVGGGLQSFLEIVNAAGAYGKGADYGTMASGILQYLNSQNIAPTAANMRQYGSQMQRLAGPTKMSFADIPQLAKHGAAFAGKLTPEEQIGMYGSLRQILEGPDAATAMGSIVSNLAKARDKTDAKDWFRKMKIKPEDIDFVGEDLDTVLGNLKAGVDRLPEKEKEAALNRLVEQSGVSGIRYLMSNRDFVQKNIAIQNDMPGFERDVEFAQSGPNAAKRRLDLQREYAAAEADEGLLGGSANTFQAMDVAMQNQGYGYWRRSTAWGQAKLMNTLGMMPTEAVKYVAPADPGSGFSGALGGLAYGLGISDSAPNGRLVNETANVLERSGGDAMVVQALRDNTAVVQENNKLLQENNKKPPVKVMPKDNRQPPAPVPAAALGGR